MYGAVGYYALAPKTEDFNGKKFMRAVIIGALVGIYAVWTGNLSLPASEIEMHASAASFGILGFASFIVDQAAGKLWEMIEEKVLPRFRGKSEPST